MKRIWIACGILSVCGVLQPSGHCAPETNSNPSLGDTLVFLGPVREETVLRWNGYTKSGDGSMTVKINVNDFDYTFFARLGEQVADKKRKMNYKVSKFQFTETEEVDPATGVKRRKEISLLTLIRLDDSEEIVLTYQVPWRDKRLKAKLHNRLNDQVMVVAKSEEFKLDDQTYKVGEITEEGVVIIDSFKQEFKLRSQKKSSE